MAFGLGKPERSKIVVAHFMLGNTYSYTPQLWTRQMQLASQAGIDGFSLNLGPEEWQLRQALVAASLCPPEFKLLLSLDGNVLPTSTSEHAHLLAETVVSFYSAGGGAHILRRGKTQKAVLSTFGGADASFGGMGWTGFLRMLQDRGLNVFFMPSFFKPPHELIANPIIDGIFSWNSGWRMGDGPLTTDEDQPFLRCGKPYMAAVSPCFFTHYGTEPPWGWNKNWIYASDENLYATRWEDVLSIKPDMVQIISWNDFGESHYIGPVEGSQPGSESWTDGMDHAGWLELTAHLISRFKSGEKSSSTNGTTQENIAFSHRPHPAAMNATDDPVGRPRHSHRARDLISLTSILSQPCSLSITILSAELPQPRTRTIELPKGTHSTTVPFVPGLVALVASRGGREVARGSSEVRASCQLYNFNQTTGVIRL